MPATAETTEEYLATNAVLAVLRVTNTYHIYQGCSFPPPYQSVLGKSELAIFPQGPGVVALPALHTQFWTGTCEGEWKYRGGVEQHVNLSRSQQYTLFTQLDGGNNIIALL